MLKIQEEEELVRRTIDQCDTKQAAQEKIEIEKSQTAKVNVDERERKHRAKVEKM